MQRSIVSIIEVFVENYNLLYNFYAENYGFPYKIYYNDFVVYSVFCNFHYSEHYIQFLAGIFGCCFYQLNLIVIQNVSIKESRQAIAVLYSPIFPSARSIEDRYIIFTGQPLQMPQWNNFFGTYRLHANPPPPHYGPIQKNVRTF